MNNLRMGDSIKITELKEHSIVLNELNGTCFSVEKTGAHIIKCINQNQTFDEIVDSLCQKYSVCIEDASDDLKMFIHLLEINHIIASSREFDTCNFK